MGGSIPAALSEANNELPFSAGVGAGLMGGAEDVSRVGCRGT